MRELHDHYFREAKREGYLSRAAYKLVEIDDRRRLLRPGARFLDCGAAPGSWLQVVAKRVGRNGVVVGVDLTEIRQRIGSGNVAVIQGDVTAVAARDLLAAAPDGRSERFDVILSDMAPSTTGVHGMDHHRSVHLCTTLLDRAAELLAPGGGLVMKVFEGEAYPDLLRQTRELFENVKGFKPRASRGVSTEMYVVATGYRGPVREPSPEARPEPRKPSRGWGD